MGHIMLGSVLSGLSSTTRALLGQGESSVNIWLRSAAGVSPQVTILHDHITILHDHITILHDHITILHDHITILYDHITILCHEIMRSSVLSPRTPKPKPKDTKRPKPLPGHHKPLTGKFCALRSKSAHYTGVDPKH